MADNNLKSDTPTPDVSVIIPAYNASEFLAECVDSVVAQDFKNWEAIIVDDGSTDDTYDIASRYAAADPRIKVFRTVNGGISRARNFGISKGSANRLFFLDSDDLIHPQSLGVLLSVAKRSDAEIVIGGIYESNRLPEWELNCTEKYIDVTAQSAIIQILYQNKLTPAPWGRLFLRELFDNERFLDGKRYEDLELTPRLFVQASKVAIVDYPLYFYRQNDSSFLHKWTPSRLDALEAVDRIETLAKKRYPWMVRPSEDRKLSANFNMFILGVKNGHPEVCDRCWKVIKKYRFASLSDPKVRLKNKLGIIASFPGKWFLKTIAKLT